jgi:hypothetical protein
MRALTRRRNSARQLINNFPPCTYVLIAQHDRPIDLQILAIISLGYTMTSSPADQSKEKEKRFATSRLTLSYLDGPRFVPAVTEPG